MRRFPGLVVFLLACALAPVVIYSAADHPSWAYGFSSPPTGAPAAEARPAPPPPGGQPPEVTLPGSGKKYPADHLFTLPGSDKKYTFGQIYNRFDAADWYPGDHPAMPQIVAKGNMATGIIACPLCHLPNGNGYPESAALSGLSEEYIVHAMMDMKNGLRKSADARKYDTDRMINIARVMTDEEMRTAARYFASFPYTSWMRVVEAKTVPKTRSLRPVMNVVIEGGGSEPLGNRILEVPENTERSDLIDPRTGFIAYVPEGSIKRGETLVKTGGGGKTIACGVCHGADLNGMGPVPALAGRSPSYLVRQLHDMQVGARKGTWTEQMKPVVEKLTAEDYINIGAYLASRPVAPRPTQTAAR